MAALDLSPLSGYTPFPGPVALIILDGVGIGDHSAADGVHQAHTPVLDSLLARPLSTQLKAHGIAVGLPSDDDMGNSEVGHNTLGAGRVFAQGAKLVNAAIESGSVFAGDAWQQVRRRAAGGGTVHFLGLLSDGNVHSHIDQLTALLRRASTDGCRRVRVHALLDGRDVAPRSALTYIDQLEAVLSELRGEDRDYAIASGGGRMVTTMDRYEADWSVVERGWRAHVLGEARAFASASEAVRTMYDEDEGATDQYLDAFVIARDGRPIGTIEDGDAVVCFNFRGDRAIEISRAFDDDALTAFDRRRVPRVFYAGMMQYDGDAKVPDHYLVEPPAIDRTLSEYLCTAGVSSYAISETQKYGHVTYFWNGNKSGYIDERLEQFVEIPSDRVVFDERPWMKAAEITDALVGAVRGGKHKFVRANYANGDMVGHTGNPQAIRVAMESVDLALARLLPAIKKAQGLAIITADHGNADVMWTEKNGVRTPMVSHTLNPVPFVIEDYTGGPPLRLAPVPEAGLANVAATVLQTLGYHAPEDYARSLLH